MSRFKGKSCIYCGSFENITRDHVPPKNIFPDPKPGNLITVPSCKKCNQTAGKDDEYFRLAFSIRYDLFLHEEIQKNWGKVKRGLSRKEGKGLRIDLMNNLKILDAYSKGGIYLGKVPGYNVDMKRINGVIERVMKGVFYHHKKYSLPRNIKVATYSVQDMQITEHEAIELYNSLISFVAVSSLQSYGAGVFNYKIRFLADNSDAGVFLSTFYDKVAFIGLFFCDV
jgi:hypothetical protein